MDYYVRSQIPVLSFDEAPEGLDYDSIRNAVCERMCSILCVEVQGKLYGIITKGDISRSKNAGMEKVSINRGFIFLEGKNFIRAREIFHEQENLREIPVVDHDRHLLGICSRNDDLLYLEYNSPWERNRYVRPYLENSVKDVRFVMAPKGDLRRQRMIDQWIGEFEKCGVRCEKIDFSDIAEKQLEETPILVVDEETISAAGTVLESLDGGQILNTVVSTFRSFESTMSDHAYDELILKLTESGIKVYNMYFSEDESTEGRRRLWEGMRSWLDKPGARDYQPYVMPSCAQEFYGELNTGDYAAEVGKLHFGMESNSIYTRMKDTKSRYLNIVNGERVTVGQPENAERTVWCFGPCFIIGGYVEDKYTIESFLQERLNQEGYSCKVVNYGCYETLFQRMIRITSTPMKPGDIVVMNLANHLTEGAESIDVMELLDKNNVPNGWLLNLPVHCNHKVNKIFADYLFERMVRDGALTSEVSPDEKRTMLSRELAVNSLYLDLHFNDFHPKAGEIIGGIGMHGNPFTLGHRYLIETTSKQVDHLIVQIIEDDLGFFSFAERFAMAVEGTRDLPNVHIVAGGAFQATRNVFKEYFVRVEPTDMRESATVDTLIFAEIIAKRLGITRRYIGDEKHNPKMQFFNELLKEILPSYGIEVIELPRAQAGGRSISASVARSAAIAGDRETLLANIPESTLKFFIGTDD